MYESFFSSDTTTYLEYMSWFRVIGKPYLLSVEVRSMQLCHKRPRRSSQQHSYSLIVSQTPIVSLFYRGRLLVLPPSCGVEDTRWEARMVSHLNTKEGNRGKDKCESGYEDEYEGRHEDKEDEDDDHNEKEELVSRG
ncbi:hypothetical protein Gohar_026645 [Gossypium harknessii]|uniref:Uncharacterized protein n=1 Tax=Gossypium harknessii TaxID=34285 RepID=A0A7J9HSQ7_9ROSI|nr:hypothetical protein [Gossypium harknessii]